MNFSLIEHAMPSRNDVLCARRLCCPGLAAGRAWGRQGRDGTRRCCHDDGNLAEVVSHYAKLGIGRRDIEALLRPLPIRLAPIDTALSYEAGMLRPITIAGGLRLGDRYCSALARREGMPALTAERRWPSIAIAAGVEVELIR